MMRSTICAVCAVLVLQVTALAEEPVAAAQAKTVPAGPPPKARIDEKVYDFGEIWEGDKVEHDFVVGNDGKGVLDIASVRAGCGCTATQFDKTIEPGKTGKIHVTFNTAGKGTLPKTIITVQTNDPANLQLELRMEGKAKKKIEITPYNGAYFGRTIKTESEPIKLKMLSHLPKPFKPELEPLRSNADRFKLRLVELQQDKEYELTVAPQPPFPEGSTSTSLTVKTGIEEIPTITVPISLYVPPAIEVTPSLIALFTPPPRELPRPIVIELNAPGQMRLLSASCTDPKIKTSVIEEKPGRRFRVLCQIPAGYNIANGQKVEVSIETDYAPKKLISVPVTMTMLPTSRPQAPTTRAAAGPRSSSPSPEGHVVLSGPGNHYE